MRASWIGQSGSMSWVEKSPGHGADIVEEIEGGFCSFRVDGTCADQKAKVSVDLFG